jgi:hypothetical protein
MEDCFGQDSSGVLTLPEITITGQADPTSSAAPAAAAPAASSMQLPSTSELVISSGVGAVGMAVGMRFIGALGGPLGALLGIAVGYGVAKALKV